MQQFKKDQQIPLTQVTDPNTGQVYYSPQNVVYNDKNGNGPQYLRNVIVDQAATASYFSGSITNAISASYALTASYVAGFSASSVSASYALTASYVNPLVQNVIITGSIYLPNNPYSIYFSGSGDASRLIWNNTDGTLDLGLKGGNVTLQVGQETLARVVNKTGGDLLEANFQIVRVRSVAEGGAQGQRLAVVLAQADSDADSATTLGVVTETILNNQEGFITVFGTVRGINTTGAKSYGGLETWVDGDMLYLSPFYPGYLTNVKPTAPNHLVIVGYIEYAHANNGKIFVKIDNGWEIGELHDVKDNTTSGSYGDLLVKSGSVWTNSRQLTGSYAITGSLTATSFTGSFSGSATAPGSTTQVVFNNGGVLGANSGFVYSGSRVGIGTTTPSYPLEVSGSARVNGTLFTNAVSFRPDGLTSIIPSNDSFNPANNGNQLRFTSNLYTTAGYGYNFINATSTLVWTSGTGGLIYLFTGYAPTSGTGQYRFINIEGTINQTGGANGITRGLYLAPTLTAAADWRSIENTVGNNLLNSTSGNTYIGLSTNAGTAKLQVRGAGATSATNTFIVQNSTPTNLLTIQDNGQFTFSSPIISLASSQSAFVISQSISQSNVVGAQVYGVNITPTFFATTASQTETAFRVSATFTGSAITTGSTNIIADFGATSVGSMLTITDVTSGSIYKVNDVSGLPILEATSDWTVRMYNYPSVVFEKTGSRIGIGKTNPSATLDISGSVLITGSLTISGSSTLTNIGPTVLTGPTIINGSDLTSAWEPYPPDWVSNGGTDPDIADGTIEGYYKVIGKTCFVRGSITMGVSTTFGTDEWLIGLPFSAINPDAIQMSVNLLDDASAWYNAQFNGAKAGLSNRTAIQYIDILGGTADSVTPSRPFTWASGDRIIWNGSYEIA